MILFVNMSFFHLRELINRANSILESEPSFIELPEDKPIAFFGDFHGDYEAAKLLGSKYPAAEFTRVALGDYVDRAPARGSSLDTIGFLLREKVESPKRTFLLRGNHEFEGTFKEEGFGDELFYKFDNNEHNEIINLFGKLFSNFPYVAATLDVIALHGGFPDLKNERELREIPKGVDDYMQEEVVSQVVWNDNVLSGNPFCFPLKERGVYGSVAGRKGENMDYFRKYGQEFLDHMLGLLGKRVLIRGHDPKIKGTSLDNKVLTLISSRENSGHGNISGNFAAVALPGKRIMNVGDLKLEFF